MSEETEEKEEKEEKPDNLRLYIKKLEEWPEDLPPSPAELREIRKKIHLTVEEKDKLEDLAENHIRRARQALNAQAYDQAAAELSRAAQLRPRDSRPRTELAGIYLQRSLERGYRRNDRQKALRLARKALEINPSDQEARQFLHSYRRMNADFRSARYRKYVLPGVIVLVLLLVFAVRQKDWIINFFQSPQSTPDFVRTEKIPSRPDHRPRRIPALITGTDKTALDMEITHSETGRHNEIPFVDVRGRLKPVSVPFQSADMLLRGRSVSGEELFSIPFTIGSETSPPLRPGETLPFAVYRYPPADDSDLNEIELQTLKARFREDLPPIVPGKAEIVWDIPQPGGTSLKAEVRNPRFFEAYDRQVVLMELAITNSGTSNIKELAVEVSLDSRWQPYRFSAVSPQEPVLERTESRVWNVVLNYPLSENAEDKPVTVRITNADWE